MAAPKKIPEKKGVTLDLELKDEPQFKDSPISVVRSKNIPSQPATKTIPRSGRPKARKEPFRINPLAALAGALIAGFLLSTFIGSMPAKAPLVSASHPVASEKPQPITTESLTKPAPLPPVVINDPMKGAMRAGLSELGTEMDAKGNTLFTIRVKPKFVCHVGDIEAMRNTFGKTGSVLLSLEPMAEPGQTKAQAVTRTLSIQEIIDGTRVTLPIDLKESGVYGIYICGDAAGTRSCGGKQAADFDRILAFKDLDIAANAVFYYQFSVIGLDQAAVYSGAAKDIGGAREQLVAKKPNKDWRAQLLKASAMMKGVESLPPVTVVEKDIVTMELQLAMANPSGQCP